MSAERRNVVLLTIDAWRPDFVDEHAGVRLTPALDAVKDRTVRFERAYASAPWTTPALVSAFTGQSPLDHRVWFQWDAPSARGPALVRRLVDAGWSCPNLTYLNELDNYWNLGYAAAETPARPLDGADATVIDALSATPEPFFLWFHYKFVHLPYWQPARYRRALGVETVPEHLRSSVGTGFVVPRAEHSFEPGDAEIMRRMYASGVLAMNTWLERVLGTIDSCGLADRTSVVLTSDHGEELLEHGHVGHASTAHHAHLFEEVLRIPLLVIDPRVTAPGVRSTRVWGPDLYPTLGALAGLPPDTGPDPRSAGVDLSGAVFGPDEPAVAPDRPFVLHSASMGCPTPRERTGESVTGVTDGRHKLVVALREGVEHVALYDLKADPGERIPIDDPARTAALRARLRRGLQPV